jgi:hypothetical protein
MPKSLSIIHLEMDELGLSSAICTTLHGINLVSSVIYINLQKIDVISAICSNLQSIDVIGLLITNNNIM